jgi:hypothetical protein
LHACELSTLHAVYYVVQVGLLSYDVNDSNADGIFEPGDNLYICRIVITNNGKLTLPEGACASAPSIGYSSTRITTFGDQLKVSNVQPLAQIHTITDLVSYHFLHLDLPLVY